MNQRQLTKKEEEFAVSARESTLTALGEFLSTMEDQNSLKSQRKQAYRSLKDKYQEFALSQ